MNSVIPTVLSMGQGGICRLITRSRIRAEYRLICSYVWSTIGETFPGRWQFSQFCWMIGATSLANVRSVLGLRMSVTLTG